MEYYKGDLFKPTICGIGYKGELWVGDERDRVLQSRWSSILARCYNPNNKNYKNYGARGVTVSEDWFNFSNFKKWFLENNWDINSDERLVIDKDILSVGCKIYSKDTCLLVPHTINTIFAGLFKEYDSKNDKTGVSAIYKQNDGKYTVGIFNTQFSNFISLDGAKNMRAEMYRILVFEMVNNYPNMPDKVKNAILNYDFHSAI